MLIYTDGVTSSDGITVKPEDKDSGQTTSSLAQSTIWFYVSVMMMLIRF